MTNDSGDAPSVNMMGASEASTLNVAPIISPDQDAMIRHLTMLFGRARSGKIEITAIHTDKDAKHGARSYFFDTGSFEVAAEHADKVNRQPGWNVYVGAALRIDEVFPGKAAQDNDFLETYAVWADADDGDQMQEARRVYRDLSISPGMVVVTGRTPSTRAQLWWPLETPIRDINVLRGMLRGICTKLGTDTRVCTGKQLMRLAGSLNWPKKDDRVLERTEIYIPSDGASEFMNEQLLRAFPPLETLKAEDVKSEVVIEPAGALGLGEMVEDGRELHTFRWVRAAFKELVGTTGAEPTPTELYDFIAPAYFRKVSQRRPGRGPAFLRQKCTEAVTSFRQGQIPGCASLDEGVENWRKKHPAPSVLESDPEDDGAPIFDPWERFPVPDFPLHTLPPKLANFITMTSTSVGGDINAVSMAALTACSGALDQEFRLRMKKTGTWRVPPRLWTVLVGDPSSKKTPIMSSCVAPLRKAEKAAVDAYRKDYARWAQNKKDKDTDEGDEPPKAIRFVLNNITSEKLGEVLSRQNRGALVEQDELAGWIGSMDKYSGGNGAAADRSFWLQAYNAASYTVDRLGRGEIFIDNLCVSFLGGVQAARLSKLGDLTSDGLLQRFIPVMMADSAFPQEIEDDFAHAAYDNLIANLVSRRPCTLMASEGALQAFDAFQRHIHTLERMTGLGEHFCAFLGKLTGIQGSLALLLHLLDASDAQYDPVSQSAAERATTILMDFVIPHALEFYNVTLDKGDWMRIRSIASFILTSDADRFTSADFTRAMRELRGLSVGDLAKVISPLVAGGWLTEDPAHIPARAWIVVDGLRDALASRREIEAERRKNAFIALGGIRSKTRLEDE